MAPTMELHALRNALHETAQRGQAARQEHGAGNAQGHRSADAQAADRVLADSGGEVDALEKAARVHHA